METCYSCYVKASVVCLCPRTYQLRISLLEFGIYVDTDTGTITEGRGTLTWEGRPQQFTTCGSYLLVVDTKFIEVRHMETGKLTQIIVGDNIRCISDTPGCAATTSPYIMMSSNVVRIDSTTPHPRPQASLPEGLYQCCMQERAYY